MSDCINLEQANTAPKRRKSKRCCYATSILTTVPVANTGAGIQINFTLYPKGLLGVTVNSK